MAIESQGTLFRRASTATVNSSASTAMDIQSTVIVCTGTIDFTTAGLGFTTSMLIQCDAKDTAIYAIKSVSGTAIAIYGTFQTTGATNIIISGYDMGEVGEIVDFNGPGGAAGVIDITHLRSTAKEKLMGIPDEGQISLSLNYNPTDAGQLGLQSDRRARYKNLYDILFTDCTVSASAMPSRGAFWGYCLQFSEQGAVDAKVQANAVIEITDMVQYSTKVTT